MLEKVEYIGNRKYTHIIPELTEEEIDKRKKDILFRIYNLLSNN